MGCIVNIQIISILCPKNTLAGRQGPVTRAACKCNNSHRIGGGDETSIRLGCTNSGSDVA